MQIGLVEASALSHSQIIMQLLWQLPFLIYNSSIVTERLLDGFYMLIIGNITCSSTPATLGNEMMASNVFLVI
jgi:hypothetical protein